MIHDLCPQTAHNLVVSAKGAELDMLTCIKRNKRKQYAYLHCPYLAYRELGNHLLQVTNHLYIFF